MTTTTTSAPALSPNFWDIYLRDFGLMIAAIALTRLAAVFAPALALRGRSR